MAPSPEAQFQPGQNPLTAGLSPTETPEALPPLQSPTDVTPKDTPEDLMKELRRRAEESSLQRKASRDQLSKFVEQLQAKAQEHDLQSKQLQQTLAAAVDPGSIQKSIAPPTAKSLLQDMLYNYNAQNAARFTGGKYVPIQQARFDRAVQQHEMQVGDIVKQQQALHNDALQSQGMLTNLRTAMQAMDAKDQAEHGADEKQLDQMMILNGKTSLDPKPVSGANLLGTFQLDALGNPMDKDGSYQIQRDGFKRPIGAIPIQAGRLMRGKIFYNKEEDKWQTPLENPFTGKVMKLDDTIMPPGMMPTEADYRIPVAQPDGTIALQPMVRTTRKIGPGTAAPPPVQQTAPPSGQGSSGPAEGGNSSTRAMGRIVGGKSMSPKELEAARQQYRLLENTQDLVSRIHDKVPMLENLITAGKIKFATAHDNDASGVGRLLLTRAGGLTKDEEGLAADMISMTENINLLRGPLGATGFRGPEAFQALIGQAAGSPLREPGITRAILRNTMNHLLSNYSAKAESLAGRNGPFSQPDIDPQIFKYYLMANGEDFTKAQAAAFRQGWNMKGKGKK